MQPSSDTALKHLAKERICWGSLHPRKVANLSIIRRLKNYSPGAETYDEQMRLSCIHNLPVHLNTLRCIYMHIYIYTHAPSGIYILPNQNAVGLPQTHAASIMRFLHTHIRSGGPQVTKIWYCRNSC